MFFSPLEQFDVIFLFSFYLNSSDFSFLSTLLPLLLILLFFFFFKVFFVKDFKLVPDFWQFFFEMLFKFVLDIVYQQVGKVGFIYFPFIFTLFSFILFCNLISLTPFGIALTSHIIMIFFLSFSLCFSVFLIGLLTHNLKFLKIFVPTAPLALLFILIPIEICSYFIRPLSLAIRLSANIMAGHTLVFIISSFVLNMGYLKI
jgi:F-type H+-transporting ATPase subunit a